MHVCVYVCVCVCMYSRLLHTSQVVSLYRLVLQCIASKRLEDIFCLIEQKRASFS